MAAKPRFDGEWVKLGELAKCISKKNKDGHCTTVCSVTNSQGFVLSTEYFSKEVFSKELRSYKLVERNQLAYNPSRINVGSIALQDIDDEVVVSPLYVVFSVDTNRIDPAYLLRYLKSSPGLNQVEFQSIGTVRNNLKYDGLCRIPIFLPPLEAQRSRVRSLIALETEIKDAEELLSKFDALVKSRFVEMFSDGSFPRRSLSSLSTSMQNGLSPSKAGIHRAKVMTLSAITQGGFDESAWKEGAFKDEPSPDKRISGDCCYVCRGNGNLSLVGTGEFAPSSMPDLVFPDTMIEVRVKQEEVLPAYLTIAWKQPCARDQIERFAKTTNGTYKINQKALGDVEIPVPPLALQQEFASFVAEVDKSRFIVQQQIEKLQMLYDSLAQEYFS